MTHGADALPIALRIGQPLHASQGFFHAAPKPTYIPAHSGTKHGIRATFVKTSAWVDAPGLSDYDNP